MATTVHLPGDLLARIDRRAADLGISRNRYIVQALSRSLIEDTGWSRRFLACLHEAACDGDREPGFDPFRDAIRGRCPPRRRVPPA